MKSKRHTPFKSKDNIIKALLYRGRAQRQLFIYAQRARDEVFSKRVEVRSVIEYSNMCRQECNYCGMNRYSGLKRYTLSDNSFLSQAEKLYRIGRRVIMIQAGEENSNNYFNTLFNLLKEIKERYSDLTLICSLGNLPLDKYKKLRDIGVERYILKFETSSPQLYKIIKPSDTLKNRLTHINRLKKLGFQVSSGNITGLPGQSLESLAEDLLLLKKLDLPMGSTSIFIPNEMSNYASYPAGNIDTALNFMAILRIMCSGMLIPTTSSLELVRKNGQYLGIKAGANAVTLHDGTPKHGESEYIIYNKNRYKPRDILFKIIKKAGLQAHSGSLIKDKPENTLFHKLIDKNLKQKRVAIYSEGRKYTYEDLSRLTAKFCSFLQNNGLQEGKVVLLALFDSLEFVVAFLSCIRLGIIAGLANPQLSKEEWQLILSDIHPHRILTTESVCRLLKDKRIIKIANEDSSDYFFSLLAKQAESNKFRAGDKNNPAIILYTSGTTGKPKGVIHTYKDLFVDNFAKTILKMTEKDIVFSWARMYSGFGLNVNLLFPFHCGAGVILSRNIPNAFSLQKILNPKPSLFFVVPHICEYLIEHKNSLKKSLSRVRIFVSSGDKLYGDTFKRWQSAYGRKILDCFGSTEMLHPFISNIPGKEKINSCGKPVEGFKVRFDRTGRIFCKGPSLSVGYYGDDKVTHEKMIRGWFKSDDVGYMNQKGYIFFKGRKNLVFKLGGWISILDIEDTLRKCRLVKEIAVVRRRKGLDYYSSLHKNIEQDSAEREIRRYCMKNLPIREFPRRIYLIERIPKTRNGKIDRRYLESLGGE